MSESESNDTTEVPPGHAAPETVELPAPPVQMPSTPSEETRPEVLPTWTHPDSPRQPLGEGIPNAEKASSLGRRPDFGGAGLADFDRE